VHSIPCIHVHIYLDLIYNTILYIVYVNIYIYIFTLYPDIRSCTSIFKIVQLLYEDKA